jgi:hypothetical protein
MSWGISIKLPLTLIVVILLLLLVLPVSVFPMVEILLLELQSNLLQEEHLALVMLLDSNLHRAL